MEVSRRARSGVKGSVVAGSVWESRMKLDEVKGGIKVFTGGEDQTNPEDSSLDLDNTSTTSSISAKKVVKKGLVTSSSSVGGGGKRRTWKSEGPIQIAKGKKLEEECNGVIKRSPTQVKKSLDGVIVKSPIQVKKGNEKTPIPIQGRKLRSDEDVKVTTCKSSKELDEREMESEVETRNSVKSEPEKVLELEAEAEEEEEPLVVVGTKEEEIGSEESCKEFGVCEDKVVSSSQTCGVVVEVKSTPELMVVDGQDHEDEDEDEDDDVLDGDEEDEEIEVDIEKKSLDIKEINIQEVEDSNKVEVETKEIGLLVEDKSKNLEIKQPELEPNRVEFSTPEEEKPRKVLVNEEKSKNFEPKRMEFSTPEQKPNKIVVNQEKSKKLEPKRMEFSTPEQKPKKVVVNEEKRIAPPSPVVNRQPPPVVKRATIYQNVPKPTPSVPLNKVKLSGYPETRGKLQNLVDLVMWKDISRSAFVFGIGTFIIISSSYTKDLNVSSISIISYLGLVYLAAIFLYRSLVCRGVVYVQETNHVVGEEEAIWLLKLVLPYLNEFLLKIRALFSGDPATTIKLAVVLFIFARCGSFITISKLAKLGFLGVFTVPKVYSSYSNQLASYAKFWIRRFRDAWDSCSHKKAVALAVFTLVWNLSSMVARVWAIFMMFVAVRYYQQTIEMCCDWEEDAAEETEQTLQRNVNGRQECGPNKTPTKVKKGS